MKRGVDPTDDGKCSFQEKKPKLIQKAKSSRKPDIDEESTSPVSGTVIRKLAKGEPVPEVTKGDIDPEFNLVEVTDEAKEELSKIDNKIGEYLCR